MSIEYLKNNMTQSDFMTWVRFFKKENENNFRIEEASPFFVAQNKQLARITYELYLIRCGLASSPPKESESDFYVRPIYELEKIKAEQEKEQSLTPEQIEAYKKSKAIRSKRVWASLLKIPKQQMESPNIIKNNKYPSVPKSGKGLLYKNLKEESKAEKSQKVWGMLLNINKNKKPSSTNLYPPVPKSARGKLYGNSNSSS